MISRIALLACLAASLSVGHAEETSPSLAQSATFTTSGSGWEWSLGAQLRQMEIGWRTSALALHDAVSFDGSSDDLVVTAGLQVSRVLSEDSSSVVRFEAGYGYTFVDFDSGEVTVGDTPDEIYTLDISQFEASLHQFHAGVSFSKKVSDKLELGLAFGPTLTIVDAEFKATQEAFEEVREDVGVFRGGHGLRDSGASAVFGVYGEARARYNVSEKVFVEASAGYHWMDSKSYGNSSFGASFEPKSWTVGVKVGFKF
jgi:hypothetical protein